MYRQVGDLRVERGIAVWGLIVRHLVLPNNLARTDAVMRDQYYPAHEAWNYAELSRRITAEEY